MFQRKDKAIEELLLIDASVVPLPKASDDSWRNIEISIFFSCSTESICGQAAEVVRELVGASRHPEDVDQLALSVKF